MTIDFSLERSTKYQELMPDPFETQTPAPLRYTARLGKKRRANTAVARKKSLRLCLSASPVGQKGSQVSSIAPQVRRSRGKAQFTEKLMLCQADHNKVLPEEEVKCPKQTGYKC